MKKLGAFCISLLSLVASAQTLPSYWETTEYYKSRTLQPINASSAYARGYTGLGSVIAILDTGINYNSNEFKNKIVAAKDFSGSGSVMDTYGHGTHVAGIAAAARNSVGMEGVAFDASLMIGKVSTGNFISMYTVIQALDWAGTNGAHVANISLGSSVPTNGIKSIGGGFYTTPLTNTGKYYYDNPAQWASAMKNDIVVVVAAGNDGSAYPTSQAQMATAVDSKGNLILGGRMVIAGNWNSQNNTFATSSNGAGTLCMNFSAGKCQDKYKVSDFYLMAPGMGIYSTVPTSIVNSGYANMSGTSMSAPAISGGVAIIRQMWPQMTGANIVKLLLTTANKNLPGYNVDLMGQGLMDLNKATQPVGAVGIVTTGRLAKVPNITPIILTGGSASTAKLNNVMVMDSFDRDFYVKGKNFTGYIAQPETDARQVAMPYLTHNGYTQFNRYTDHFTQNVGNLEFTLYRDTQLDYVPPMIEIGYNKQFESARLKLSAGGFSERDRWLGNTAYGSTQQSNNYTQFFGLNIETPIAEGVKAYGSLYHGTTIAHANNDYISNLRPVQSYSWTVGLEKNLTKYDSVGVMVYQPVVAYRAIADTTLATGMDANYTPTSSGTINMAATIKEVRSGVYYKFLNTKTNANMVAFFEHRQNYMGQEGINSNIFGTSINYRF